MPEPKGKNIPYKKRGISIIYVDKYLKLSSVMERVSNYAYEKYIKSSSYTKEQVDIELAKLDKFFKDSYQECIDMYSFIHGELIVDFMDEALREYLIKKIPVDVGGQVLAFIDSDMVDNMFNFNEISSIDALMPEILDYYKNHMVDDLGNIIKK